MSKRQFTEFVSEMQRNAALLAELNARAVEDRSFGPHQFVAFAASRGYLFSVRDLPSELRHGAASRKRRTRTQEGSRR